jgi:hypothetical protein
MKALNKHYYYICHQQCAIVINSYDTKIIKDDVNGIQETATKNKDKTSS